MTFLPLPLLFLGVFAQAPASPAATDQADKLGPIQPDRPGLTNGPAIVAMGHPQIEFGYQQARFGDSTTFDYGDGATVRVGVVKNFEVRVGVPSYLVVRVPGASATGFADESVGFKWAFTPEAEPKHAAFSVIGGVELTTGARALRSPQVQPGVTAIGSYVIDDQSEFGINLGATRAADESGTFAQFLASASYGRDLGHGFGGAVEVFTIQSQVARVPQSTYADINFTKLLRDDLQIDATIGQGFNGVSRDYFFGFGIAYRF